MTDFTLADGPGTLAYTGTGGSIDDSIIDTPAGNPAQTGFIFVGNSGQATDADLASFTLGSVPEFDYGDFDVFVAVNNYPDGYVKGVTLTLNKANNSTNLVPTVTASVTTGENSTGNSATVVEFNVTGAESGEVLDVGSAGTSTLTLSAVSFEVPEPSTYAMMLGGLALLGFCVRRKLA